MKRVPPSGIPTKVNKNIFLYFDVIQISNKNQTELLEMKNQKLRKNGRHEK